jgi:hypothetical protein
VRIARINWGILLGTQGTYCAKSRGSPWLSPLGSGGSQNDQAGEAGHCYQRPIVSKLAQGTIRSESTQIRWFSWRPGGRLVCINGGRLKGSNESWRTTLGSQKPNRKQAEYQPKQESTYSFLWGFRRKSCCWWWWWWVRTNQASHRSMRQWF